MSSLVATRYPRCLEDSFDYAPDWRHQQVNEYLLKTQQAQSTPHVEFTFPEDEQDMWVLNYYLFRRTGECDPEAQLSLQYAYHVWSQNSVRGTGSRIKAMLVSGLDAGQIAFRLKTRTQHVEAFCKIFFDVEEALQCEDYISGMVFPFASAPTMEPWEAKERFWMISAYLLKWQGLQHVLYRNINFTRDEVEQLTGMIRSAIVAQGLDWMVYARGYDLPRAADLDRFLELAEVEREKEIEGTNKIEEWGNNLYQMLTSKMGEGPSNSAVALLTQTTAQILPPKSPKRTKRFTRENIDLSLQRPVKKAKSNIIP